MQQNFTPEQSQKLYAIDCMAKWFASYFNRRVHEIVEAANDA